MMISQALRGGLRIRNVDELSELRAAIGATYPTTGVISSVMRGKSGDVEKDAVIETEDVDAKSIGKGSR